jgi:glutathione S-transferase
MIKLFELAGNDPSLRFSPYCWRIRLALAHKSLEPATRPWRFHEKTSLPGAPQNHTVPVIVDGKTIVADSAVIAQYLEERYANGPSLFGSAGGEAHARFILAWTDTILIPALGPILAPVILPLLHPDDQAGYREAREARFGATLEQLGAGRGKRLPALRAILAPLRRTLAQAPFLGGDEPSFADYAVFSCFQWARCVGVNDILDADDTLHPWLDAVLDMFDGLARRAPVAA